MEWFCVRLMRNQGTLIHVPQYLCRSFQTSLCQERRSLTRNAFTYTELQASNTCRNLLPSTTTDSVCRLKFGQSLSRGRPLFSDIEIRNITVWTHSNGPPVPIWISQRGQNCFHTSAFHRALPAPIVWLILKPLQKIAAIILGRSIRKWWLALPPNKQLLLRQEAWQRRWKLLAVGMAAMVLVTIYVLTHLDESPVTGRTRLLVFSEKTYMELAAVTAEAYMEEFGTSLISEEDPRHQVVERVVQHMAQRNKDIPEVSSVQWSVHVVDSPIINAFVLPNGKVFIFTGMLEAVADVHQLTFILGHEMAHAVMGHSAEQASVSHVVDALALVLLTTIWALCPRDSLAMLGHWIQTKLQQLLFDRPYSRKLESEADQVGLQLAAKACADVRAGPVFWQQMEINDQLRREPTVPEWFSTHPSHKNRVTQLDRLVPQYLKLRESCSCPALPNTDPRQVFSQSVKVLLEQERVKADDRKRASQPGGLATALPTSETGTVPSQSPEASLKTAT
ncbi:hypothetical protein UPYG_G00028420 [Umbra pygmaea]|uniref:Metalloendopeptidase OMA1, mitochondrial n=1 Tax=Umbra pygmaea TaxID=75934 RepID=A0ABD0Y631_UMBPY